MAGYYADKLSAERLRACYDLAPPRARAYLEAEIEYVLEQTPPSALVLELGCGYGRVLRRLVPRARAVAGIDTSPESLQLAREFVGPASNVHVAAMDAARSVAKSSKQRDQSQGFRLEMRPDPGSPGSGPGMMLCLTRDF